MKSKKHQIVIIGGGTAGITVAAQMMRKNKKLDVAIIDPSDKHFYQPAFTLVGAGTFNYDNTIRPMKKIIPSGVKWIKEYVKSIEPESKDRKSVV